MAIVTKGSGGSIKFSGTGGSINIASSGGGAGGGGGGGGGAPDSSNLYSLLRRGVNQTTTTNGFDETVIASWTDARGAGLGYPKFVPQGRWTTGGPAIGCTIDADGSVIIRSDNVHKATFMRATTDDSDAALSNTADASWTAYVRFANPLYNGNPIAGSNYIFSAFSNTNDGAGDDSSVGESVRLFPQSTGWTTGIWRLSVQQPVGGSWTYPVNGETIAGSQFVPNPNEYQVAILRVSPSQGWSFRLANSSNGGGSFGSSLAYNAASPFNLGRALWLGGQDGGNFPISDFAIYKSYHDESTATQVISHLTAAP